MSNTDKIALIIGIDIYNSEDLDQLPSCKKDAEDLCRLLSDQEYKIFKDGPLIGSNLDSTYGWVTVRDAIIDFFSDAKPSQTLLFYFSGHGIPAKNEIYLASSKTDPKRPRSTGFALSELTGLMSESKSKRIVGIIDACYSGTANLPDSPFKIKAPKETAKDALATYDKIWKNTPKTRGICLLLSSQGYEPSNAVKGTNSLYTGYLLEGLGGIKFRTDDNGRNIQYSGSVDDNGNVTPALLHEYVYYKVASVADQVPEIKYDGASTIVLAEYPKLAREREVAISNTIIKEDKKDWWKNPIILIVIAVIAIGSVIVITQMYPAPIHYPPPNISYPVSQAYGTGVKINGRAHSETGNVTRIHVNWGDGTSSNRTAFPISHNYCKPSLYTILMTAYDTHEASRDVPVSANVVNNAFDTGSPYHLTGCWVSTSTNLIYYIRQIGNTVWGLGINTSNVIFPKYNVFKGTINGSNISGEWIDVRLGTNIEQGTLNIAIPENVTEVGSLTIQETTEGFTGASLEHRAISISTSTASETPVRPDPKQLTGLWLNQEDRGIYYVRQIGNTIWWYGLSSTGLVPGFTSIFKGTIKDKIITGEWADVPLGTNLEYGILDLKLDQNSSGEISSFHKVGLNSFEFRGSHWKILTSKTNVLVPHLESVGFSSIP